ncbi:short-chain dehydrogenase [Photobacterium gaetbulicola]|uniref:Short-chain dehydrogenase n=1 Tax=Photobacterium gaetbulicola TaxID=1295392 RepID=A0A0B9GVB6_9GAMM|nr:SDR family oxidoreductase [Photobacterium gaetbulicola]KHT62666.1 short-chain dehydrogenase [Photobacterium gaetbulicola]
MELTNKRILLTGACGGIGCELARQLASKGAHLILNGRDQRKLDRLLQQLSTNGQHAGQPHMCFKADLARSSDLNALAQQCQQWRNDGVAIDIVINNAGVNHFAFLAQRDGPSIEQEIKLNLVAPILLSQKALCWLNRPGLILNVGSTFAAIGYPGYTTYCASKAGLYRFSEALSRELEEANIKVLYIAPRATETSLNDQRVSQMNRQLGNATDMPPVVASAIVRSLEQEVSARWIGWPEKVFARINQLFPAVVSAAIRKQSAVISAFAHKTH